MFVIFGATGKVGRVTASALRRAGQPVRAVVHSAPGGDALAAIGCEIALADLLDPVSVRAAIAGAHAVQVVCPVPIGDDQPEATMRAFIDVAADALDAGPPAAVLAISDYGAELPYHAGITSLFHYLEARLTPVPTRLTLLRSAEHMENWLRQIPAVASSGTLPSLHHPLDKMFPTVATQDVGALAAELLLDTTPFHGARVVSIEGPYRVTAIHVARVLSELYNTTITPWALPRSEWPAMLRRAGLTENHARLICDLYDVHNAGKIDVEAGATERRFGKTELGEVFATVATAL